MTYVTCIFTSEWNNET